MTAATLLLLYCSAIVCASLAGGFIPHWIRLTHTRLQVALSFTAGAMLGVGLLHLVPHAQALLGSLDRTMMFALAGFLIMFFIERVFHFHHHGSVDGTEGAEPGEPDHVCDHGHHGHEHLPTPASGAGLTVLQPATATCGSGEYGSHSHGGRAPSWGAALLGLALHSLLDGVALAAGVQAEQAKHGNLRWAGVAVFLVILLHKPFDSLTLATLTAVGGRSSALRHRVNFAYACAVPLGVLLFQSGLLTFGREASIVWIGGVLALAAGMFLCISTSDLLPELQFHTHDRGKLSAALLLGIALAWGIVYFEEYGHDHARRLAPSPAPLAAPTATSPTP